MSQIVPGVLLGAGVYDLVGRGDPNTRTDMPQLFSAQVGSTYRRIDGTPGSVFYVCVVAGTPASGWSAAIAAKWTAIA